VSNVRQETEHRFSLCWTFPSTSPGAGAVRRRGEGKLRYLHRRKSFYAPESCRADGRLAAFCASAVPCMPRERSAGFWMERTLPRLSVVHVRYSSMISRFPLSGPLEKFMRWMMLSSGAGCPKRRGLLQTIFGPCLREGRAAEGVLLHEWLTCRSAGA
jgi:hypothetical protein